ncbi:hypothetical protein HDA40_001868 [Hamadaea flava]|uniref:DUF6193 family natural product biosynthesis protein n=1 Tax=Hamadaea flava TaxID=1742688 RepID=A0ABV8LSZ6_9ACTN|nr:DUF6193 family natural product biosynthesis protein [Hamadaea flava]MCP2323361.1 hypothetical protein [Hamadaea flava]
MPSDPTPPVEQVRDGIWLRQLDRSRDDWFTTQLVRLLTAAQATPLRTLFPYTSHNSLHFSRCSNYPFTHDCPWIWFSPEGKFITYPPHTSLVLQGNLADPSPALADTQNPEIAINAAVEALPASWRHVWVGTVEDDPADNSGRI